MKKINYLTVALLGALFLIIARIFYVVFTEKYTVSAEDAVGILLLLFGLRLLIKQSVTGEFILLILILLVLGNVFKINISFATGGYTTVNYVSIGSLTFNPFGSLLLVFYTLINRSSIRLHISNLRYGSAEEQNEEHNKMITFYYNKFSECQQEEYNAAIQIIKEYPEEAQIALRRLEAEKQNDG